MVVRREFSHSVSRTEKCCAGAESVCARSSGVFGFAQVGEWLKPTDCKSVPLRRYGGSNPPLCTRSEDGRNASVVDEPEAKLTRKYDQVVTMKL